MAHRPNHLRLVTLGSAHPAQIWESHYSLRVGRMGSCEVVLTDSSISRQHAELLCTPSGWVVRDLGSRNGTFVNGVRVGRIEEKLRQGDILQFGDIYLLVAAIATNQEATSSNLLERWQIAGKANQSWAEIHQLVNSPSAQTKCGKSLSLVLAQAGRLTYNGQLFCSYLESLLWEVAENLNAGGCAVWLTDEKTAFLTQQAGIEVVSGSCPPDGDGKSMAAFALQQAETLLFRDGTPPRPDTGHASVICAILRSSSSRLGVLQVMSSPRNQPFDQADLELADALALVLAGGIDSMRRLYEREQQLLLESIAALTKFVGIRDHLHEDHAQRVTDYALLLAEELRLPDEDRFYLRIGGPLHDLAKLGFTDAVLHKPGQLDVHELQHIRSCVLKAAALLESSPSLVPLVPIVRSHHEHWDGNGYPDGLAGEGIPVLGRIIALADAFDAMTSDRPYRQALTLDEAYSEMHSKAGSQFDPHYVEVWLRLRPRIEEMFAQRKKFTRTLSLEALRQALGPKQHLSSGTTTAST